MINYQRTKSLIATGLLLIFQAMTVNASIYDASNSIAAGLPASSYSDNSHWASNTTAQDLFNGGSWGTTGWGTYWAQVDFGKTQSIEGVQVTSNQWPNGDYSVSVYISDTAIGNNWSSLNPVATYSQYTTSGTPISLLFAQFSGEFLEIVANGGPSWTSVNNANVISAASAVPIPGAVWLFLSSIIGFASLSRKKQSVA